MLELILADQLADLPQYWHLVVKNGNFIFLLLELILADQVTDLPPHPLLASSGQEWQFYISTSRANIGRSTGRYTPHLSVRHHGMYIMGCIWQPLWILQEKVGICFCF